MNEEISCNVLTSVDDVPDGFVCVAQITENELEQKFLHRESRAGRLIRLVVKRKKTNSKGRVFFPEKLARKTLDRHRQAKLFSNELGKIPTDDEKTLSNQIEKLRGEIDELRQLLTLVFSDDLTEKTEGSPNGV